jgi:hypothetical protein
VTKCLTVIVGDAQVIGIGARRIGHSTAKRGASNGTATACITMSKMIRGIYLSETADLPILMIDKVLSIATRILAGAWWALKNTKVVTVLVDGCL